MHAEAYGFMVEQARMLRSILGRTPQLVVEIGGRNVNGSVRPLFPAHQYVSIDIEPGPGVDVVADGATFTPAQAADMVICCEVLEHAANYEALIDNSYAMLRPGGVLLLTCASDPRATHSGFDGGPELRNGEHYRNVDQDELIDWLKGSGFEKVMVRYHPRGDLYARAFKPERA